MKKIKKTIITLLVIISLFITACGNKNGDEVSSILKNGIKASDLSIKDFEIENGTSKKYGKDYYYTTLTNNSEYPIVSFQIDYQPKKDTTEDDLKVYDEFIKEHADWIENDNLFGVILRSSGEKLVEKGEKIENAVVNIGYDTYSWYNTPNQEQFELMEPKELQIAVIGENNVLYVAYYNYNNKEWTIDKENRELNTWPNTEISKKVITPECKYTLLSSDIDNEEKIEFDCYGIDKKQFKSYIKKLQESGIKAKEVNDSYNSYYDSIETEDDYEITINGYFEKNKAKISLEK